MNAPSSACDTKNRTMTTLPNVVERESCEETFERSDARRRTPQRTSQRSQVWECSSEQPRFPYPVREYQAACHPVCSVTTGAHSRKLGRFMGPRSRRADAAGSFGRRFGDFLAPGRSESASDVQRSVAVTAGAVDLTRRRPGASERGRRAASSHARIAAARAGPRPPRGRRRAWRPDWRMTCQARSPPSSGSSASASRVRT